MEHKNTSTNESQQEFFDKSQVKNSESGSHEIEKGVDRKRQQSTGVAENPQVEPEKPADQSDPALDPQAAKVQFDRPLEVPGEFELSLSDLHDWKYHCAAMSRQSDGADAGLIAAAFTPDLIQPLVVIKRDDDTHVVKDGRRRLQALRAALHNKMDTKVRCVLYHGTEEQAVEEVCDDALGKVARTPIETAVAVRNVHRVSGVTQLAIAERYPALKKDQVSRMVRAAHAYQEYPAVFNLLKEPDRVPIDTCVRFHEEMKGADDEKIAEFIYRAEALAADGVSYKPAELLKAFDIEGPAKKAGPAASDPLEPIDIITGSDDKPIGALEMHPDNVARLSLPDPHGMSIDERVAAAEAFIKQIKRYFELDAS